MPRLYYDTFHPTIHFQISSSSLSLPKPMISRCSIVQSHHPNFTISYLIDSCSLSPDTAALTSQKLHLPSAERPDSVLTLLREHGFTDTQISNLIRKRLLFLLANPDILLPKFQFFLSIGIFNTNLARTLTAYPTLLSRSLEKQIIPCYNFLKSVLISDEKVASSLKRTSWVFLEDHKKNLVPNLNLLKEMDVPKSCVTLLLTHFSEALMQKKKNFAKLSKEIKEMGFNPKNTIFVLAIHVLSGEGNKSIYNRCYEVYKRFKGFSISRGEVERMDEQTMNFKDRGCPPSQPKPLLNRTRLALREERSARRNLPPPRNLLPPRKTLPPPCKTLPPPSRKTLLQRLEIPALKSAATCARHRPTCRRCAGRCRRGAKTLHPPPRKTLHPPPRKTLPQLLEERSIGRSRGFGYVTFASMDDAKDVLSGEHVLGNRMLEVKVATPKWGYGIPSGRPSRADWRDLGMGHDEMRGLLPIAFEYSARMLFTKASSSAHMLHAMNCAPK
ncbi:hypothetical protein AHAS_Ahas06G0105500 [Arachis hypogaea]